MRRPWDGGARKAPVVKRKPCPFGCGSHVDEFKDLGMTVRLDTQPPPVTYDLTQPQYRDRLYEYYGPYLGWSRKFLPTRTWRDLRLAHQCPGYEQQALKVKLKEERR